MPAMIAVHGAHAGAQQIAIGQHDLHPAQIAGVQAVGCVADAVIERIADCNLEEVLRRRIFEPAGMGDTVLRRCDDDFLPNSATLHMSRSAGGFEKSYLGTALAGEGGVVSTVDDLLHWLTRLDRPLVGSAETWHALRTPQKLNNGASTSYGLGLRSGSYRGLATVGHAGGVMGGNAVMLNVPSAALDVAVLVNRQDLSAIELAERILATFIPRVEAATVLLDCALKDGVFHSAVSDRVVRLLRRESKQIAVIDGAEYAAAADGDGVIRPQGLYGHMNWEIRVAGDGEKPAAVRFVDFGDSDELTRLETAGESTEAAMIGRYRNERLGIELAISKQAYGLRLHCVGAFGSADYELALLGKAVCWARSLSAMPWRGVLSFADSCQTLRFTTARTVGLVFRRLT